MPLGQLVHAVREYPDDSTRVYSPMPVTSRWWQRVFHFAGFSKVAAPQRTGDVPLRRGAAGPRGSAGGLLRAGARIGAANQGGAIDIRYLRLGLLGSRGGQRGYVVPAGATR